MDATSGRSLLFLATMVNACRVLPRKIEAIVQARRQGVAFEVCLVSNDAGLAGASPGRHRDNSIQAEAVQASHPHCATELPQLQRNVERVFLLRILINSSMVDVTSTLDAGRSLATQLGEPLLSVQHLIELVAPVLRLLDLCKDRPDLINCEAKADDEAGYEDTIRQRDGFLKRQIGFVQKVIVEKVWIDWESELERTEVGLSEIILGRLIVPPVYDDHYDLDGYDMEGSTSPYDRRQIWTEIASSSYAVLLDLISRRSNPTAPALHPSALLFITKSLDRLSRSFTLREEYFGTFGTFCAATTNADARSNVLSLNQWETRIKRLMSVPTKVANACGVAATARGDGRVAMDVPFALSTW